MKRFIYSIGILAAGVLSAVSCQKEIAPENESGKMVTVTFVAEAPATKSAAVEGDSGVSYKWTDGDEDRMHLFTVNEGNSLTEVTGAEVTKVSDTKLTITATLPEGSKVRAIMASAFTTSTKHPKLSDSQSPSINQYDPTADILISDDETVSGSMPEEGLVFTRKVVINKMTLHGLSTQEIVKKVIISSDNYLAGNYAGEAINEGKKQVTLNYGDGIQVSKTSDKLAGTGAFSAYFVAMANESHTLSLRVETDKNVYEKTLGQAISLNLGQFTRFDVGLPAGTPISDAVDYTLVTSANSLPAVGKVGDIIIVNGTYGMAGQNANNRAATPVPSANNGVISLDNTSTAHVFSLYHTDDGFLIRDKIDESGYLYAAGTKTSGTNYLKSKAIADDDCYWTITCSDDVSHVVSVKNEKTPYMRFNSGSTLFSCYSSESQSPVSIYLNTSSVIDIPAVVNTSTEDAPYTVAEARQKTDELGDGSLADVYVKGIITTIITAFNNNVVSFDITDEGDSSGDKFRIYRASAQSVNDFNIGDAVEFKGLLKKYNTTYELDGSDTDCALTLIAQLHAPVISPNGGSFTDSQTVTISADSGASIYYSTDGSAPSVAYSASFSLTETTTVKAKATKGILTTGIVESTFTKSSGGGTTTTYTFTSKAWADSSNSWTSGKDGNQFTSGRGVQITTGASGANATTKSEFSNVSKVEVTYSTNASNGAGSIAIKVGSNTAHSQNVTKDGGTSDRTLTFNIDPSETGTVTITTTCTTNSIYVKSVAITHN